MVIFIRYPMKQICNQCHNDYDVEEFNPCEIRSIMEEEQNARSAATYVRYAHDAL